MTTSKSKDDKTKTVLYQQMILQEKQQKQFCYKPYRTIHNYWLYESFNEVYQSRTLQNFAIPERR